MESHRETLGKKMLYYENTKLKRKEEFKRKLGNKYTNKWPVRTLASLLKPSKHTGMSHTSLRI